MYSVCPSAPGWCKERFELPGQTFLSVSGLLLTGRDNWDGNRQPIFCSRRLPEFIKAPAEICIVPGQISGNLGRLIGEQGKDHSHETGQKTASDQNVNDDDPPCARNPPAMQPFHSRADRCPEHDGNKKEKQHHPQAV